MDYVYLAKRYMWEMSINLKVDFHYSKIFLLSKTLHDFVYLAKHYMWEVSINLKVDFHYTKTFLLSKTLHDFCLLSKTLHVGNFNESES